MASSLITLKSFWLQRETRMVKISVSVFFFFFFLFVSYVIVTKKLESPQSVLSSSTSVDQLYRTGYHFQPPKNWLNDPNGPMIYKGIYHNFYQWNPTGPDWGNIVWAHSTSTDLINWIIHDPIMVPSEPYDIGGCWSGSTTILPGNKPAILYTGYQQDKQVQNLALPKNLSDPYLLEWVKSPANPVMAPDSVNKITPESFRDPTTAWVGLDGKWRVIIGSKTGMLGHAILYTSEDFVNWTKSSNPLHSAAGTGMWECPDFYPVPKHGLGGVDTSTISPDVKHVLKQSLDERAHDYYTIGTYNAVEDVYVPDEGSIENFSGLRYDYGKFYGSKSFFDDVKDRRVLWSWINESSPTEDYIKRGWAGMMAIPRQVWLDTSGKQLIQQPVEEIKSLRTNPININGKLMKEKSTLPISGVTASQADVEVSFSFTASELDKAEAMDPSWTDPQLLCSQKSASVEGSIGPFGLLVLASKDLQEYTAVFYRIFKAQNKFVVLMCSDQSRSSVNEANDKTTYGAFMNVDPLREDLSLRSLIDHSIIESFGGEGKACITSRVYPKLAIGDDAHLLVFNNGTQSVTMLNLNAWSMKKADIITNMKGEDK